MQQFLPEWKDVDECKDWLDGRKRNDGTSDDLYAWCIYCGYSMSNHLKQLKNHSLTEIHRKAKAKYENSQPERDLMKEFTKTDLTNGVALLEIRLCCFIAEHNLPLSLLDPLVDLLRVCFPNDRVLKQLHMGRQKGSNIMREGTYHISILYIF